MYKLTLKTYTKQSEQALKDQILCTVDVVLSCRYAQEIQNYLSGKPQGEYACVKKK